MRVLAVTNMYPTSLVPHLGTFVEEQVKSLKRIGLDVDVMFVDRAQQGKRAYIGLRRKVYTRIAEFQPDVVHLMYGGVMADQITGSIKDRPTVVSFCGSDLLGEHLSGTFRKFLAGYGVLASHRAAKRAAAIVVKSKNLYDALPYYVDRSKVRIIPNGVDFETFKALDQDTCRNRLGWRADRLNILFPTNNGDPCKRIDLAWAAVEFARQSNIPAEIHQLRGVPHKEVPIWLNASDVVLLTSRHEGSPNVIKEALACDVPVVSVDVGDVRQRLEGIEGCYLALPDPKDLAAKLLLVHFRGQRVQGRITMQELSLESIAYRLKLLYTEVLETSIENGKIKASSVWNKFVRG